MTIKPPFGHPIRNTHFSFSPTYVPLNHGSFGTFPLSVTQHQNQLQTQALERPDTFIVFDLPVLIDESRAAIAPLLGVDVDEVVFVPNATTGVNVVLRNLRWEEGDVVVCFSTIYGACEKSLVSVGEVLPVQMEVVELQYPVEDEEILGRLEERVGKVRQEGKRIRLAMFDTVLTFPGARMPWERLVAKCKELEVLSLIDGAHGIGHIDLRELGKVAPDFFVSNCHKWLYTPRGCAVFHVPFKNQHLIRTSLPTSHGYQHPNKPPEKIDGKTPFVHLFEFVATIDYSPYACVPAALSFRQKICGGEEEIRKYCFNLARTGGAAVAKILGTHVMDTKSGTMSQCCFANVALPLAFGEGKKFGTDEAPRIQKWLNGTAVREFDTYLQIALHGGIMWVRLSAQIYLEGKDFEWVGYRLKELCVRIEGGEVDR
ncbi:PLP-dependent transferase [Mollisia scopiformis]|uniref:PLP-dependent transferase n=1 Tax=Mollisia scopiformis TaxID=149040 RepID=A0A132BC21_MOLSC|nr:PLP-dependent transferase [Mollisia scopiformis]KUJ09207.1 PLP-dependent transferase [Mollisia scopiformis]